MPLLTPHRNREGVSYTPSLLEIDEILEHRAASQPRGARADVFVSVSRLLQTSATKNEGVSSLTVRTAGHFLCRVLFGL